MSREMKKLKVKLSHTIMRNAGKLVEKSIQEMSGRDTDIVDRKFIRERENKG